MLLELGSVVLGSILRATIGVVDAVPRLPPAGDCRFERGERQASIDAPTDGVADHAPRPAIENGWQIDEARAMAKYVMSATQSWFGPVGTTSFATFGKIGPSRSLSVVATKRLRGRTVAARSGWSGGFDALELTPGTQPQRD
jgi:hypothetical protein